MQKSLLASIAILTFVSVQAAAAPSSPPPTFVPGKGLMHRWVVDPSIASPSAAPPTGKGGRFGTGAPVSGAIATLSANDTSPCADHEFRAASTAGVSNASLVNRHKYCQEYQNLPEMLKVDLMRRTPDTQWEWAEEMDVHVLERLRQFMASQRGTTVMLNAPADNHQLTAAESVMGIKFPSEIREAYALFNGVVRDEPPGRPSDRPRGPELFLEGCDWADLDRVVSEWQSMRKVEAELKASGAWPDVPDRDIKPGLRMRPVHWHPKWIPIGIGGGGINLVCVDMAPTRWGMTGQLVYAGDSGPVLAADSFFSYLERLLDAVDSGKLLLDGRGFWTSPAGTGAHRLPPLAK